MDVQDLSHNRRIASLMRLTRDLGLSRTPDETLRVVRRGLADAHGFVASVLLSTRGLGPGQYRVVSTDLVDGSGNGRLRDDPDLVRSGGVVAAILGRAEPQLIQSVDWSRDPSFRETLGGCASVMAIPLGGDRLPMNWALLLRKSPERFAASDLEEAVERAALLGALLENQSLAGELARANQRLDRDARQVGELQRALLPASQPRIAGRRGQL
jgi:phosphoserine phosphatase RsbU/P